jgi:hypothetical protein
MATDIGTPFDTNHIEPCENENTNTISSHRANRPSVNRRKGLRKLGVSEDDVQFAERLLKQIPNCPNDPNKAERIFGYAQSRLARDKALRTLGTTEDEVEVENAKNLGALGIGGRRRSYSNPATRTERASHNKRHRRETAVEEKKPCEVKMLKTQAEEAANEIELLKARIDELEKLLQRQSVS